MIHDYEARAAALDPQRSFIVQAPAGSGKTALLVYRMLTLLAQVEEPQQVLAITFTRKATAEMRDRVLQLIRKAELNESGDNVFEQQGIDLANTVLARDRQLGWNLLSSPHQLQIMTIDALCARLTGSMPWLSRLGDRPRTTDNAEEHYAAAVEQLLLELLDEESELSRDIQTVLLELDFNYNKSRRLFVSMLAKRDQWLRHLLQNDLAKLKSVLEHAWQTIANEHIAELSRLLPETRLRQLVDLAKHAAQTLAARDSDDASSLAAFESFDRSLRFLGVEHWRALRHLLLLANGDGYRKTVNIKLGFAPKTAEKEKIQAVLDEFRENDVLHAALLETDHLPELQFSDEDWRQLTALEHVLKSLAALLQLRFRSVGECDHSEVTQRANLALQELDNPTDLALRMDYQLQHILVDEFQDTSHGQIELLKRLTMGWLQTDNNVAKTLFLVGDPMQSIYRFREADVSLFLRVSENASSHVFENIRIESLVLTENFRSSANLVDWFNASFKSSFPKRNNVLSGGIRYAHATSNRPTIGQCVDHHLAHNKVQEAELLVRALQAAIDDLPDPDAQVAVLVRSRAQLDHLLPHIQAAGIAYAGVDIQSMAEQQAVIDVLALAKAICREDDRVSWLALLRGPWCGLSLTEMKQLVGRQDQTIWAQLCACDLDTLTINSDTKNRLRRFIDLLDKTLAQRQQIGLSDLVRWVWQMLGGEQTLVGARLEDIESVFELIQALQKGGDLPSISALDRALATLYARPTDDTDSGVARVVISTIHKAKGLQYDTVILPSLASPPRASNKEMLMWAEHQNAIGELQLLLAPLRIESDAQGSHYGYLRQLDQKRANNEAIRLMYVACTRAERRLVLIGCAKLKEETQEVIKPRANTLLATIWGTVENDFEFTLPSTEPPTAERSYAQTLSRLPVGYQRYTKDSVQWQPAQQLNTQQDIEELDDAEHLEYQWATEVATAVGVVLHRWLQFAAGQAINTQVEQPLLQRWRSELSALRVPADRIDYALKRLTKAVSNLQTDTDAHFLFADYAEQQNEYTLSAFEQGVVTQYRIDRTFVDGNGVRWILDYKSTETRNQNVHAFVDEQVATRHRGQLEKYGVLMRQIDDRPIKLAVYFPMLAQLRSWDYASAD